MMYFEEEEEWPPCWTPSDDWMILSLQNKEEGEEYINVHAVYN